MSQELPQRRITDNMERSKDTVVTFGDIYSINLGINKSFETLSKTMEEHRKNSKTDDDTFKVEMKKTNDDFKTDMKKLNDEFKVDIKKQVECINTEKKSYVPWKTMLVLLSIVGGILYFCFTFALEAKFLSENVYSKYSSVEETLGDLNEKLDSIIEIKIKK